MEKLFELIKLNQNDLLIVKFKKKYFNKNFFIKK